jgi:hypothetical protein
MGAEVQFVPNAKFDLMFYTHEIGPILLSAKTSLRERYKQADLEAMALRAVYRRSKTFLVTLNEQEARNVQAKIHSGDILVRGPIFTGSLLRMGPSVLFETQQAQIVISSARVEPYDLGVMRELGIEIEKKSFVLLKSRMYCRPVFAPLSKGLIECDSDQGGPTSSNYTRFNFQKVRRPIFPLDALPS